MDSINTQMRWKEEKKVRLMASLLLLCSSWVSAAQCKVVEGFGGCQSWTSSWHLWTACCPQVSCTRKHTTDYKCAHTHTKNPDTCMLELNKAHKHTRNKTCTNTQRKQPHKNTQTHTEVEKLWYKRNCGTLCLSSQTQGTRVPFGKSLITVNLPLIGFLLWQSQRLFGGWTNNPLS